MAGLVDSSSDSEGGEGEAKTGDLALQDILAESDSDGETPVKPPSKKPEESSLPNILLNNSPAKPLAIDKIEPNFVSPQKTENTQPDKQISENTNKTDNVLVSDSPTESPTKLVETSLVNVQFQPEKLAVVGTEEFKFSSPTHKELLEEILQEKDEENHPPTSPSSIKRGSTNTKPKPQAGPTSLMKSLSTRLVLKLEKVDQLDKNQPFDPLDIVNKYENSSRAEERHEKCIRPIEENMAKCTMGIRRMAYTEYKGIGANLTNPDHEKMWGRPSCICVFLIV